MILYVNQAGYQTAVEAINLQNSVTQSMFLLYYNKLYNFFDCKQDQTTLHKGLKFGRSWNENILPTGSSV